MKFNKALTGCVITMSLMVTGSAVMAATVPGKITGKEVNLRKSPGTASTILAKMSYSNVTLVDKADGWYKVTFGNKTGWVSDDYVKLQASSGVINANGVNFRAGPGTNTKVISSLKKNTSVTVLDISKGWNKVKIGTKVGYVASNFVSIASSNSAAATAAAKANTTALSRGTTALSTDTEVATTIYNELISYAKKFLGVKYLYGGASPVSGFDCSGYVGYVFKNFGIKLNRSAEDMYQNGIKVSKSQLKAGDILFFDASSRKASGKIDHAGIYLGNDSFIHASSTNGKVMIQKLSEYRGTYIGAKRVI